MKTTVDRVDEVTVKVHVEVPVKKVRKALDHAAQHLAHNVKVPGFRAGKAPRKLIEQKVGKDVVISAAVDEFLGKFWAEAAKKSELMPVSQPKIDLEVFDEITGCVFDAEVQVRPDFTLPDMSSLSVAYPTWDVTDEQIAAELDQMRERFAEIEPVERAAATGDYVTIDLTFEVDGETQDDHEVRDAMYLVGSAGVTAKLDDELQGKAAEAEFSYSDDLPETFSEDLGGKEATFNVTVKDVRAKVLPELDDDFAELASEFETLQDLRKDIRGKILRRNIVEAENSVRTELLTEYLKMTDVAIPSELVDSIVENRIGAVKQQAGAMGMTYEQVLASEDMTEEGFEEETRENAAETVKTQLILDEIAKVHELTVSQDELNLEVHNQAWSQGIDPSRYAEMIEQQNAWRSVAADALRRNAVNMMFDEATITGGPSDEVREEAGLVPATVESDEEAAADDE